MATNPAWRVPPRAWQEQFARWIERPEEVALLQAATFFDFRQVHGDLDVEERLAPPDDVVALAELTMLQRRWIKDALHLVHTCQESVRIAHRVDLIA